MSTTKRTFNIGEISYINCEIFNYPLEKLLLNKDLFSSLETKLEVNLVKDTPSKLNNLFMTGEIDLAPISAYAYLSMKDNCDLIKRVSISSFGAVKSVLFFSELSFQDLKKLQESEAKGNREIDAQESLLEIFVSEESASSVALLKILLAEKYHLKINEIKFTQFTGTGLGLRNKLLIGDKALKEDKNNYKYVYDLGLEWFEMTNGLPMVFGVWALKTAYFSKHQEIKTCVQDLIILAKTMGLNEDFNKILEKVEKEKEIEKKILLEYYKSLNYDLTEDHLKALSLYENYLKKWELI